MSKLIRCLCAATFVVGISLAGIGCAEQCAGTCDKTDSCCSKKTDAKNTCAKKCSKPCPSKKKAETK